MSFNNKTIVKSTRKQHQCHGCLRHIEKGSEAINHKGYNDSWYNIYFHTTCDEVVSKFINEIDRFGDGIPEGAIVQLEDHYGERLVEV